MYKGETEGKKKARNGGTLLFSVDKSLLVMFQNSHQWLLCKRQHAGRRTQNAIEEDIEVIKLKDYTRTN